MSDKPANQHPPTRGARRSAAGSVLVALLVATASLTGCSQQIDDQPRIEAYEKSSFFSDDLGMRPPVEGTVPRGGLRIDTAFFEGKMDGKPVTALPVELDKALVERGRQRYDAFCSACHGYAGDGDGMVVERGFPAPPSYNTERLRKVAVGHVYDVISNGLGRMPRLSDRIPPKDRWAIVAYVRALQLSQGTEADETLRKEVDEGIAAAAAAKTKEEHGAHGEDYGDGEHGDGEHGDGEQEDHDDE